MNRPQNKHLKPFKSRAELGGQLDPRINVGGRPKLLREETAKALAEIDEQGVTKARRIVDSMAELAQKQLPHSVTAFDKLCKIMEAGAEEQSKDRPFDISQLNPNILAAMKWAARSGK